MKNLYPISVFSFCLFVFCQCAASRKIEAAHKNEATVRLWFEEGWNQGHNEQLVEQVFASDWEDGNPLRSNQTSGYEGMYQFVRFYQKAFTETHFTITHLFADETHVAIRYDVAARHVGEAFGLSPTGKRFISSGIVIYEMKEGKIRRTWQELDLMGIIKQLRSEGD